MRGEPRRRLDPPYQLNVPLDKIPLVQADRVALWRANTGVLAEKTRLGQAANREKIEELKRAGVKYQAIDTLVHGKTQGGGHRRGPTRGSI